MHLIELNQFLNCHSISPISEQTYARIQQGGKLSSIRQAMQASHQQPNAVQYIARLLQENSEKPVSIQRNSGATQLSLTIPTSPKSPCAVQPSVLSIDLAAAPKPNFQNGYTVYSTKAALCVREDETKAQSGIPTVRLECAAALGNGTRKFQWEQKISIQLTQQELPVVTAVLLGFQSECEFRGHGPTHTKGFRLQQQGAHWFVTLFGSGISYAVPIPPADAYWVASLCIHQLQRARFGSNASDIILLLQKTVGNKPVTKATAANSVLGL